MSWKTALVKSGKLHAPGDSFVILLDTDEWFSWLTTETTHSFHFAHMCGDFTARKERKQRGQWYWVAYRQVHGKLYKIYLGKSETLTESHLCKAAEALTSLSMVEHPGTSPP